MKDVRDKMKDPSWPELVKKCHMAGVDLSAHHMGHSFVDNLQSYVVWAAVVTEVRLDVLTGQMMISRQGEYFAAKKILECSAFFCLNAEIRSIILSFNLKILILVSRCDINYDTGASISPEVDVGQVEGGLIMGLGESS